MRRQLQYREFDALRTGVRGHDGHETRYSSRDFAVWTPYLPRA